MHTARAGFSAAMMTIVIILLPPSEGKTPATHGKSVDLDALVCPELADARREVAQHLEEVSVAADAAEVLGVGKAVAHEIERNIDIFDAPAAPAHEIYTGVLYDALDYAGMTATQKKKADERILVISALWGAVGLGDSIPAYRLSMDVKLPGLGKLATYWKPRLAEALAERVEGELIIDCRSSAYQAAYVPPQEQTVTVNVVQIKDGKCKVVSHHAKHTRGEVARLLMQTRGDGPQTPQALLTAMQKHWPQTELIEPTPRKAGQLTIVLDEN